LRVCNGGAASAVQAEFEGRGAAVDGEDGGHGGLEASGEG
jgi:hypothetical protein